MSETKGATTAPDAATERSERAARGNALRRYRSLVFARPGLATATAVATVVATIMASTATLAAGWLADALLGHRATIAAAGWLLALGVGGAVLGVGASGMSARLSFHLGVQMRSSLLTHLFSLPASVFAERSVGATADRVSVDVDAFVKGTEQNVFPLISAVVTVVVSVLLAITVSPWAALGMGLWGAFTLGVLRRIAARLIDDTRVYESEQNAAFGTAEEMVDAREDLRQIDGQAFALRRWSEHAQTLWNLHTGVIRTTRSFVNVGYGASAIGLVAITAGGAVAVQRGAMTIGSVVALFGLWSGFSSALHRLLYQVRDFSGLISAGLRLEEIFAEDPEPLLVDDPVGRTPRWDRPVSVEFVGTSIRYPGETGRPALDGVSLVVEPGTSLGLVGRTGSGKSTLGKLLNRTVCPGAGMVLLDGVDVRQIPLHQLRSHVGVLNQRVEILRATLLDNVTLFDRTISRSDVVSALEQLGLAEWLAELPGGVDTLLGDPGVTLSVGEQQLVSIARVLVRNPSVLVFDETTAHLDPVTEARAQRALEQLTAGRTTITIAHRLSTLERVDSIAVLDAGRLVEHGPAAELRVADAGLFAAMLEVSERSPAADGGAADRSVRADGPRAEPLPEGTGEGPPEDPRDVDAVDRVDARPGDTSPEGALADEPDLAEPLRVAADRALLRRFGFGSLRTSLHLWTKRPRYFLLGLVGWSLGYVGTVSTILAWRWFSEALEAGRSPWAAVGLFGLISVTVLLALFTGRTWFPRWWQPLQVVIGGQLLGPQFGRRSQDRGGTNLTPGDVVTRMRGAGSDLTNYSDLWTDFSLGTIEAAVIVIISGQPSIAAVAFGPAVVIGVVGMALMRGARRNASDLSQSTGRWMGRVVESCAAARTVSAFAAEKPVLAHIGELTLHRQRLYFVSRLYNLLLTRLVEPLSELARYSLLLGAVVVDVHSRAGGGPGLRTPAAATAIAVFIALREQAGYLAVIAYAVSEWMPVRARLVRIARMLPGGEPAPLLGPGGEDDTAGEPARQAAGPLGPFDLGEQPRAMVIEPWHDIVPLPALPDREPLRELRLDGVTVEFSDGQRVVERVSAVVRRGEIVVVTGEVGSGKSSLLRAIAGLAPVTEGVFRWNDRAIDDIEAFAVPPNIAYLAQVPKLISGSVERNVTLDRPYEVQRALELAKVADDVRSWGGVDTVVGHRGMRLSGGELQRVAAARAFATEAELLVLDDLSSALDAHTETAVWASLRESGATVIAASHSPAALAAADRVINLS